MPRRPTKLTRQFAIEMDATLRELIAARAKQEGRTLRGLAERALRFYLANTSPDDEPVPATAKRRPAK